MMMNEETYLKEHLGNENHFKVPEGYFEQFAQQVMQQLPERQAKKSRLVALRPWLYAAACVAVVLVMSLTLLLPQGSGQAERGAVVAAAASPVATPTENSEFMDDAADYAMLDNVDIYACLMDN